MVNVLASIPYMPESIQNWDVNLLNWIHNTFYENGFCRFFFPLITHLGDAGLFWIALAVLFLVIGIVGTVSKKTPLEKKAIYKTWMKTGITMGVALILGLILGNGVLKHVFLRVRPYELEDALVTAETALTKIPHDTSFPSGHTLASFEASITLCFYNRKAGIPAIIVAICVALSRMFLYFHFPSDIIGGLLLAIFNSILAIIIVNLIFKIIEKKKDEKNPASL